MKYTNEWAIRIPANGNKWAVVLNKTNGDKEIEAIYDYEKQANRAKSRVLHSYNIESAEIIKW